VDASEAVPTREQIAALRQEHIGRLILQAQRAFGARAVRELRRRGHPGLGAAHAALLPHLDVDGTRITALAERTGMTKQGVGQLVADLERLGYVERATDPSDRRATLVTFTDEGWRFLRDAYEIKLATEADYASLLGEELFRQVRTALAAIVAHERADSAAGER
jgi:DNA-binding MarR family transcriptional regulator